MKTTFRLPNGDLSAYAFACGYVQRADNETTLKKDGCYHVQDLNGLWLTFTYLTEARAAFRKESLIEKESN